MPRMNAKTNKKTIPLISILRKLMEEAGLTEAALARQVNLPQTTVNRLLLGGTTDPRTYTLKPIADYFGITIGQLCGFESLPSNRITGTVNPSQRLAWRTVPIIEWDAIPSWRFDKKKISPLTHNHWISTERDLSEDAYALRSLSFMEPRFRKGSLLIIDPNAEYKDGHFIVLALDGITPTVRRIMIDGSEIWLKTFEQSQAPLKLEKKHTIYGVIVESRMDTYHV